MTRFTKSLLIASLSVSMFVPLGTAHGTAYYPWCNRDELGVNYDMNSFASRGLNQDIVFQNMKGGMAWWSEAQATLRFYYNTTTSSTAQVDPGPVYGRCQYEDSNFLASPMSAAYVNRTLWYPYACFYWPRMAQWRMVIRTDYYDVCGGPDGLAHTVQEARTSLIPIMMTFAHEFGHILALNHDSVYPYNLMADLTYGMELITGDDIYGIRTELGEGSDGRPLRYVSANQDPSDLHRLVFATQRTLPSNPYNATWRPAMSGNGYYLFSPSGTRWDLALAWIKPGTDRIRVAVANELVDNSLSVVRWVETPETSRTPVSVAVGWNNAIGVAWTGTGSDRTINFMVSTDDGVTWTKRTFQTRAIGGVSVSYSWSQHRWVLAWVSHEPPETFRYDILTNVSEDYTGTSWVDRAIGYGDSLSQPNLTPAMTCARFGSNRCLLMYRPYSLSASIMRIYQQAFEIWNNGQYLYVGAIPTVADTGNDDLGEISVARMEGADSYHKGYVFAYVWPTAANDRLHYRIKLDSYASETDAYSGPLRSYDSATSRSGFSPAYNYRTGRTLFLWKDN